MSDAAFVKVLGSWWVDAGAQALMNRANGELQLPLTAIHQHFHHHHTGTYTNTTSALQETPTSVHSFTPSRIHLSANLKTTAHLSHLLESLVSPRRQIPSTRKFDCSTKALDSH